MPTNTITIDLSQEITQTEYCRRTGDTLANLAPKLKKLSVREIPELGLRLINISAPHFDTVRVEAPLVREYTITELTALFGNLMAQFHTQAQNAATKGQNLEKGLEELTARLESLGQELEQQKQLTQVLQAEAQQKDERIQSLEASSQQLVQQQQEEVKAIQQRAAADLKSAHDVVEEKEKAYQEAKADLKTISQEKDALQKQLLDRAADRISTQVAETSLTKELQRFKEEFLLVLRSLQPPEQASKATNNKTSNDEGEGLTLPSD
jgi:ABC-type transporter Mla subunit MlaD